VWVMLLLWLMYSWLILSELQSRLNCFCNHQNL
jgi:hypothetical protein